jgi:hypothetical protein
MIGAVVWLLTVNSIWAQSQSTIKILANPKRTSVVLRWAPTDPFTWQLGNKHGYVIERFVLSENGKLAEQLKGQGKALTSQPIKPLSPAEFEKLSQTEERAAIVQEALYGTNFTVLADDAGPAAILKHNQEQENRFGMALFACDFSPQIATAAGLMWIDRSITPGVQYVYRVRLAQQPAGVAIKPGVVVVNPASERNLPQPTHLQAEFADRKVTLSWPVYLHRGFYSAYLIERSTDNKNFRPLSDIPYVFTDQERNPKKAYFVDSLPNNTQTYYYRIKGMSPFGEKGPASEVAQGTGKDDVSGMIVIQSAQVKDNRSVTLTWSFPAAFRPGVSGYYIGHATQAEGPYQDVNPKMLSPDKGTFTHQPGAHNNYYCVRVIGKDAKEVARSFPYLVQLEDTIAPVVASGLVGSVDSLGVVRLSWKPNPDADLNGYRVFRANSLGEEFVERTEYILKKPAFTDTISLNTLTKEVYYRILAVDKNYNPSPLSPYLLLKRPDRIAPVPPVLRKASLQNQGIALQWENSPSDDVASTRLYRREATAAPVLLYEWTGDSKTSILDSSLVLGKTYAYTFQVIDSAGNHSATDSPSIQFETGVRPAVSKIKSVADREQKKIVLTWKYELEGVERCVIYRAKAGQPLQLYQTMKGNPQTFEDRDLAVNNAYTYKIKVFFAGGVQSQLSQGVQVVY